MRNASKHQLTAEPAFGKEGNVKFVMMNKYVLAISGFVLLTALCSGISAGGYYDYRPCIVKGYYKRSVDADREIDEVMAEDNDPTAHSYHYGSKHGRYGYGKHTVKIQVLQRCGYRLCNSYRAKIYVYTGYHRKLCYYTNRHSKLFRTISCKVDGRKPSKIIIYWPRYRRRLEIWNLRAGKIIRAIMPKYRTKKMKYSSLRYCKIRRFKTILITDEIQNITCPTGRIRFPVGSVQDLTMRTLDGRLNNKKKIFTGAAGETFLRLAGNGYVDNISIPSGACTAKQVANGKCPFPAEFNGTGSNRPNARVVSNVLIAQNKPIPSSRGVADLLTYFGQFLDHDLDLGEPLPRDAVQINPNDLDLPIPVPKGDLFLDPDRTGNQSIPLRRFSFDLCTGNDTCQCPREQINTLSSFIDAGTVYGTDEVRSKTLRTLKDGLLITDNGNLPLNTFGLPNENPISRDPTMLRVAGDVRSNTAPTLLVLHTLFLREHNRLAKIYKKKHYKATDEEIFQFARKFVIAEIQAIVFREFLPTLLGGLQRIPKYKGYNPKVDPKVATEFSNAAFRFGHTQINEKVFRLEKNGKISRFGDILLREGFFRPERVTEEGGIDPILRGAIRNPTQEIDTKVVDELRNFLFPGAGTPLDLTAINIQRGREVGLPDFNTARKRLGLRKFASFDEITKDKKVAWTLKYLYGDVSLIDLWVGVIAEDNEKGSEFGETMRVIVVDQLTRIRDGDRFWYENILTKKEIAFVEGQTLGRIIELNTDVRTQKSVFFASGVCKAVRNFQCVKVYGY